MEVSLHGHCERQRKPEERVLGRGRGHLQNGSSDQELQHVHVSNQRHRPPHLWTGTTHLGQHLTLKKSAFMPLFLPHAVNINLLYFLFFLYFRFLTLFPRFYFISVFLRDIKQLSQNLKSGGICFSRNLGYAILAGEFTYFFQPQLSSLVLG